MSRVNLEYRRIWKNEDEKHTLLRGDLTVDKEGIINYLVMKGKRDWGTYVSFSLQDNSSPDESYNFIEEDTTRYFQKRVIITDDVYREVRRRLAHPIQVLPKIREKQKIYGCYIFFTEEDNTYFLATNDPRTTENLISDFSVPGNSTYIDGLFLSNFISALEGGDLRTYSCWKDGVLAFINMESKIRRDVFRVLVEAYGDKFNVNRFISKPSVIAFMAEHPEAIMIFDEIINLLKERSSDHDHTHTT